ncbi:hypothetical protein N7478_004977 [Penicillium angulare]|uniref:uncharacterized protein n=1 Tax=Penicillium angulare TaxID=116970 RepID=UPI0025409DEA|nr:uncharacterized protein N7478_004977 [Penicillium angulare]KAJ5279605.1 hypothetical protein N7478_004977 [Penicillium angulare]
MLLFDKRHVQNLKQPLEIIDIPHDHAPKDGVEAYRHNKIFEYEDLQAHFIATRTENYKSRLISVCQRNSWRPLQMTIEMVNLITTEHGMDETFTQLPSYFYDRKRDIEKCVCAPFTQSRFPSGLQISYTFKYPEHSPEQNKWSIRQTGVYHKRDTRKGQSTWVLFNPTPSSMGHCLAEKRLKIEQLEVTNDPLWLHWTLFSAYMPLWRVYIADIEQQILHISSQVIITSINKPLELLGHDQLKSMMNLEKRINETIAILGSAQDVLTEICDALQQDPDFDTSTKGLDGLNNVRRQCAAYLHSAMYLQKMVLSVTQALTHTVLFRDQVVAKEQNTHIFQLNKSAVFITTLTLFYLPASFLAVRNLVVHFLIAYEFRN